MSVAATLPQKRRARLVDFAERMRRRHVRLGAAAAAMRCALAAALPALALAWLAPHLGWWIGGSVSVLALLAAAVGAHRARRVSNAALLEVGDAGHDTGLDQLGDGLATWIEKERTAAAPSMADWLASDLDRDIRALPAEALHDVGRRRLGRLRWILPILIFLLLVWLVSLWWQPPWPGLLGGRPDVLGQGPLQGAGAGAVPGATGGASTPDDPSADPEPDDPERADPESPGDDPGDPEEPVEPPPSEPPPPLLDLPKQQLFVVPEFIDDGPSRRMRAHVANVGAGDGQATAARAGSAGAEGAPVETPVARREQFDRAAERAQAARHVPPRERPIVGRFFRLLRQAAK